MEDDGLLVVLVQEAFLARVSSWLSSSLRMAFYESMGFDLHSKFEWTGSLENLNRAITIYEQAIELSSEDNPNYAGFLNNLGNALEARFENIESMENLDRVITMKQQTIELTSEDDPEHADVLE